MVFPSFFHSFHIVSPFIFDRFAASGRGSLVFGYVPLFDRFAVGDGAASLGYVPPSPWPLGAFWLLFGCLLAAFGRLFGYLMEPLVPSTIYFWAIMNMMIGGMIMIIVMQSIGMICVSWTPLKAARPRASVYLLLSCRKINGPR